MSPWLSPKLSHKDEKRGVVPELSPIKTFWLGQVESEQDKRKTPETVEFPGFLGILKSRSALAELRCATGGLETVLREF